MKSQTSDNDIIETITTIKSDGDMSEEKYKEKDKYKYNKAPSALSNKKTLIINAE